MRVRAGHKNLSSKGLKLSLLFELSVRAKPLDSQAVQGKVNNRRGVKGEHLAQNQPADNGDAERITELRTGSSAEGQRHGAKKGRHGGHQDGAEAQDASLEDGFTRAFAIDALGGERKVDHQDGVLLDDTDQENDADQGNDAEVLVKDHERKHGADSRGGQRGNDREGVDVTLVENAQNNVDGNDCQGDQSKFPR